MPQLTLTKALTLQDGKLFFRRGQPIEVDEGAYHRLCLTGRLLDPDRIFESIPPAHLKRLAPGSVVTVVRSMGLGDVLMVLPVIRAMKREYPHLLFRYCTGSSYAPLVQGLEFINEVVPIIEMRGKIPNVIELRGLSERHQNRKFMDRIEIFGLYCGVEVKDFTLPIIVTDRERAHGRELIGGSGEPTIALTVRGSTGVRSWIPEHVVDFAKLAVDEGWRVVILDGDRDLKIHGLDFPEHSRIVNLSGRITLMEVKAVLAEVDYCVSPDTGLVHLSEAVGTRCLALYSTTPPALRIYHYRNVKALWRRDLPCAPCWERGCPPMTCLREITPAIVLEAIRRWDRLGRDNNPRAWAMVTASAE